MRIISQDGMIDVPYEQMIININYKNKNQIMAEGVHCNGENTIFPIAQYSTEAKAKKAMEMLRNTFENYDWLKTTGNSDEIKQVARMVTKEEFKEMTTSYFKFPVDDEVEVSS